MQCQALDHKDHKKTCDSTRKKSEKNNLQPDPNTKVLKVPAPPTLDGLCNILKQPTLTTIILCQVGMQDSQARLIAATMLHEDCTIRNINLSHNDFTSQVFGDDHFGGVFEKGQSVQQIDLSAITFSGKAGLWPGQVESNYRRNIQEHLAKRCQNKQIPNPKLTLRYFQGSSRT